MAVIIDKNLMNMASLSGLQPSAPTSAGGSFGTASPISGADFKSVLLDEVSERVGKSVNLDAIFEKAASAYNVPVKLLKAMAKAESNFNVNAVSSCGAQGIMQLMPDTAKALGVSDPFDPEQNIMGGAKYIASKLEKYGGNVKLALAAYQAGSGNVAKYGGVPPFKSTQTYIENIFNYMGEDITAGEANTSLASGTAEGGISSYIDEDESMSFYMLLAKSGLLDEYLMLKAFTTRESATDFSSALLSGAFFI